MEFVKKELFLRFYLLLLVKSKYMFMIDIVLLLNIERIIFLNMIFIGYKMKRF